MRYLYLLPLLILLGSCSNYYYIPNSHNVPLFKEKNEVKATINGCTGDDFGGLEIQAAYSPADNIGVIGNFIHGGGGESGFSGKGGEGTLGEAGVGYFTRQSNFVFETYGGVGFGNAENRYHENGSYAGASRFSLMRVFVQPTVGFSHDIVDVAFSTRFCYLSYNNPRVRDAGLMTFDTYNEVMRVSASPNHILFEPAILIRLGWRFVKFQFQTTYSANLSNRTLPMQQFLFSGGLHFSFAERFFPKRDK